VLDSHYKTQAVTAALNSSMSLLLVIIALWGAVALLVLALCLAAARASGGRPLTPSQEAHAEPQAPPHETSLQLHKAPLTHDSTA